MAFAELDIVPPGRRQAGRTQRARSAASCTSSMASRTRRSTSAVPRSTSSRSSPTRSKRQAAGTAPTAQRLDSLRAATPFGSAKRGHGTARCANIRSQDVQGSAYGRFQRALRKGNSLPAWTAAQELGDLTLPDALALCVAVRSDPQLFERASVRWHSRWSYANPDVAVPESQFVRGALAALPGPRGPHVAEALARFFSNRGQADFADALPAVS